MNRRIAIVGAPSSIGIRPYDTGEARHLDRAPGVLRQLGIVERVDAIDLGDVTPPAYRDYVRPPGRARNQPEVLDYCTSLADRIAMGVVQDRFVVLVGGDCSIVLGALLGTKRAVGGPGGPPRHFVQRGRHPKCQDPGCATGRAGCRAVLLADHDSREVVLPDRTPGSRRMIAHQSGVIMTVTATHAREGIPLVGGYGPAQAAKEALTRDLSAELAPQGIRVVGLRPYAMPETSTIKDAFEPRARASGVSWEQWQEMLASRTHARRLMSLEEMANVAVFLASEKASGMTGTIVNLTMGRLDD
jgi:hypothetical protein